MSGTSSSRGKAADPNYRSIASIRQHAATGDLFVGYAYGRGIEVPHGSEDWVDLVDLLVDICPGELKIN